MASKSNNRVENDEKYHSQPLCLTMGKTPRRVKVYLLKGEDWLDNGTGYCIGEIESETNKPYFIVRNEADSDDIILKSYLEGSIQYQRQQETLIVWTDLKGKDLALSFQETEGCADLCEFIIKVQQENYSPEISLYYVIPNNNIVDDENYLQSGGNDITELITGPINYPEDPTTDNLEATLEIINQGSNSQYTRTCILNFVTEKQYLLKLIEVFKKSEESKNLINLYTLSEIVKTLILYNEAPLIDDFLSSEEKILGLVGILEYCHEYPNFKACHRDFLKDKSKFKIVVDIPVNDDAGKLNMFKKNFHLNFLKDVVLARFLDDQTFNLISSLIYFNQVEIIKFLQDSRNNDNFLEKLFKIYEQDVNIEMKRDGVKMLHQYILIAKSLQSYQSEFFSTLVKSGLFSMIRFALQDTENTIRVLGTELIVVIIEQDVSLVSSIDKDETIDNSDPPNISNDDINIDHDETIIESKPLKLNLSDDMTLILILSKLLVEDKNSGLKMQAFEALRILLDSNIARNAANGNSDFDHLKNEFNSSNKLQHDEGISNTSDECTDINTNNYFKAFYSQAAPSLFGNLIDLAKEDTNNEDIIRKISGDELLCQHLCDLIITCTKEHETHISRPFFLENNILLGVAKILAINTKTTLKLSAIRCLKSIILLNDNFYSRYFVSNDVLSYFMGFFETVSHQDNLANSACLDFLEVILKNCDATINHGKRQNFKLYVTHLYKNYKTFFQNEINYVTLGTDLIHIVESGFYDNNDVKNTSRADTSFNSDDEYLNRHNASTPIKYDDDEYKIENRPTNGSSKPNNLFEDIEKDMESNMIGNGEKRLRENDEEDGENASVLQENDNSSASSSTLGLADMEPGRGKKKLSTSIRKKFSNAGKEIALRLRSTSTNTNNNNSNI
ncbi:uncharacterized protein AC631_03418 [Debaryomyces fabryi]|uniref:Serine/threonine-protein phosphatase 4 regulatory subunit 3 n=1 Tax=Debaryomyces fabryi TaxID=58627 RepID=A0A0V1PX35_9ASCO|nr:uncharacterized protein AC631_03418 [Debaryomyces fabryi]KSA00827.1 hypothetical protein AC631_03418 [Debaryomyces fabryi]CUM52038.1 unnamed protein product [Debaryomyces fabryi]